MDGLNSPAELVKAAKEAGYEIKVGKFPFVASGKASAAGATEGFVKVILMQNMVSS